MDEDRFVALLEQTLDKRNRIDADTHAKHHAFVDLLLERHRVRAARWEKVRAHVYGWGIITSIVGIGAALWEYVRALLRVKGGG